MRLRSARGWLDLTLPLFTNGLHTLTSGGFCWPAKAWSRGRGCSPPPSCGSAGGSALLPGRPAGSTGQRGDRAASAQGRHRRPLSWAGKRARGIFGRKMEEFKSVCNSQILVVYVFMGSRSLNGSSYNGRFFFLSQKASFSSDIMGERRWQLITVA